MNTTIRVFSVDDHVLVREGLAMVINCQPGMSMVAQASNGREAIERFHEAPAARIIILTTFDSDTEVQRAVAAGACGYMLKSAHPKDLAETIRRVHPE